MMYSGLTRSLLSFVLLMQFGVAGSPLLTADIAELVQTSASHMVAAFVPLHYHFASSTLSVVQIILEVVELILLTITLMLSQVAFNTILFTASITYEALTLLVQSKHALALLMGTQFDNRCIFGCESESVYFVIGVLHIDGHFFEEFAFNIDCYSAILVRTINFLELLDFVHCISIEARLAETIFMLAIAYMHLCSLELTIAYLADADSPQLFDLTPHHFGQFTLLSLYLAYVLLLLVVLLDCIGY